MSSDYIRGEMDHKKLVGHYLSLFINELVQRALHHDNSKLTMPEEFDAFSQISLALKPLAYGSEEYKARLREFKPALDHHFAMNRHHPEHFPNGINDMTLMDLVEMVLGDWMAASLRSNTDIQKGLLINKERFGIGDQLFGIIQHSVDEMLEFERLGGMWWRD